MTLRHLARVAGSLLREKAKRVLRSPKWRAVERHFLLSYPECAACPGKRLLQVHHVAPFHLRPELELDPRNLITLCMGPSECHLRLGHKGRWKDENPSVRADAALLKKAWQP